MDLSNTKTIEKLIKTASRAASVIHTSTKDGSAHFTAMGNLNEDTHIDYYELRDRSEHGQPRYQLITRSAYLRMPQTYFGKEAPDIPTAITHGIHIKFN